ncbi:hypothetical protein BK125_31055 [Paenibacillus odorifer]|uniref:hypothetical protein n=1 Tax=Paenibacillus odorifer TaxID=189426 RepID=UPI00097010EE|nr:hypothetical protein [Paenibacillus odorifer]OMC63272.1 hypothetical protein BK125_31055 [Paenibacillus odorifer]
MKKLENDWQYLSDPVKTILERVDINCKSCEIPIGSLVDIPYFKGVMTLEMALEILNFQDSIDNEGFFATSVENKVLSIEFIKWAI